VFKKISYSQTQLELIRLIASGIYQFWKYWLRDRQPILSKLKFESRAEPNALSLTTSVSFVLVVLLLGLGSSVLTLLAELVYCGIQKFQTSSRVMKY